MSRSVWEPPNVRPELVGGGGGKPNSSPSPLHDLAAGKLPAFHIRNFYDKELCRIIAGRISSSTISHFDYGTGVIKKLGIFLMAYLMRRSDYFDVAPEAEETLDTLFAGIEDPRRRMRGAIAGLLSFKKEVIVAEDNGRRYSCGIIRIHETGDSGPLHRDNAAADAAGFGVARFKHQLSCVLYIQQSESGGELVIYDRSWKPEDERLREVGFGYSRRVIFDENGVPARHVTIRPDAGDLVFINPNHFHEIRTVTGRTPRITLGMFLAFNDEGDSDDEDEPYVVTWS